MYICILTLVIVCIAAKPCNLLSTCHDLSSVTLEKKFPSLLSPLYLPSHPSFPSIPLRCPLQSTNTYAQTAFISTCSVGSV